MIGFEFWTLVAVLSLWTLVADLGFCTLVAHVSFWTPVPDNRFWTEVAGFGFVLYGLIWDFGHWEPILDFRR